MSDQMETALRLDWAVGLLQAIRRKVVGKVQGYEFLTIESAEGAHHPENAIISAEDYERDRQFILQMLAERKRRAAEND